MHIARRCVLIGYPNGVKGYKLWCIENQKIIVSRDVTFDEKQIPLKLVSTDSDGLRLGARVEVETQENKES